MSVSGIYRITNTVNGNFYIGSSCNIERRLSQHRRILVNNRHVNAHLQSAWNKYGGEAFEFTTILLCDKSMMLYCEQEILEQLKPAYNIALDTSAPMLGLSHTEEAKRRISETHLGERNPNFGKHHSEEHKRKLSEANKGTRNPRFGKHPSDETRRKNSEAQKGELGNMFGKHHTEETKHNLSESKKRWWAEKKATMAVDR